MQFSEQYGLWAVIAGASEGTGSAFARQLAQKGLNCLLVARREQPLLALRDELVRNFGVEADIFCTDLAVDGAAQAIFDGAVGKEIGLLVCNAGSDVHSSGFLELPLEEWRALTHRNVVTVMELCHLFGTAMKARGRGGLILVGSGAGYGGARNMAVYAGTKAFDLCLAEGLWSELKPHGVDVLSLMLGRTDTPAHRENLAKRGQLVPGNLADPDTVVREGLERLASGPVHNAGFGDEDGFALQPSAASRRERVMALQAAIQSK